MRSSQSEARRSAEYDLLQTALAHATIAVDQACVKLRRNLKLCLAQARREPLEGIPSPEHLVEDAQDAFDKSLLVADIHRKLRGAVRAVGNSAGEGGDLRHQSLESVLLAVRSVEGLLKGHRVHDTELVLKGCDDLLEITSPTATARGADVCPHGHASCEPGPDGLCACGLPR
jgi:hypothetical protein